MKKLNEVSNSPPNIQRLMLTQEEQNAKKSGSFLSLTNEELMEWSRRMGLTTETRKFDMNKKARNVTKKMMEDVAVSTGAGKRDDKKAGDAGMNKGMENGPEYVDTSPWMSDTLRGGSSNIRSGIS